MGADLMPTFGLWYDFRKPDDRPWEDFYASCLEQIEWAEELGFGSAWLTEHHFVADGYTPSPLVIAAAIGARTKRMRISTNLMLLPLHNPVRLAEDAATLSILTGGRFDMGVGQGYRPIEFETFGRSLKNRPSLLEEGAEIMRRAWAGESVEFAGKRFTLPDVTVTPVPPTPPKLFLGGMAEPAVARAVRIGDGFLTTMDIAHDVYRAELEKAGRPLSSGAIYAGSALFIDEDPEEMWERIGDLTVSWLNQYIEWGVFGSADEVSLIPDKETVLTEWPFRAVDAPAAVEQLHELVTEYRPMVKDVHFWAQVPGESFESGARRIEYIAKEVIPELRRRLAAEAD